MPDVGQIQRVPITEVWDNERGFTAWLSEHIDVLDSTVDVELTTAEAEQDAGAFRVDILAEDRGGARIAIECQFGRSDHDHLGKIVTYTAVLESPTAIWVAQDPRPEHITAINLLNELPGARFYLCKVDTIRIGDSAPAPLFTLIVGPSQAAQDAGAIKKHASERELRLKEFWTGLLPQINAKSQVFANTNPGKQQWHGAGVGKSGMNYSFEVLQNEVGVELFIDRGDTEDKVRAVYEMLEQSRKEIETKIGHELDWIDNPGVRSCRIRHRFGDGGLKQQDKWSDLQELMVQEMITFVDALQPHIDALP